MVVLHGEFELVWLPPPVVPQSLVSNEHVILGELVLEVLTTLSVVLMFMPAARTERPGLWKALIKRGTEGDFLLYEAEHAPPGADASRSATRFLNGAVDWAQGLAAQVCPTSGLLVGTPCDPPL